MAKLRAAGAVILGKTNLTELANFMTNGMRNGYSSLAARCLTRTTSTSARAAPRPAPAPKNAHANDAPKYGQGTFLQKRGDEPERSGGARRVRGHA